MKENIRKQIKNGLHEVREQKIDVAPEKVEQIMKEFMEKYDIENHFNKITKEKIYEFHNPDNYEIILKCAGREELNGYPLFFDDKWFIGLENYIREYLTKALEQEFQDDPNMDEDKRIVLENLDLHVNLTVSSAGIDRFTLTAYHYFIKNLTEVCKEFVKEHKDELPKTFNKQKIAAEVYNLEVMTLLATHYQLKGFVATIISLTVTWMQKYKKKSKKLGNFVDEIMMMTEHVVIDKIVRYMILIAIKNKNPLLLRALMSTYVSLIHRNIITYLSINVVDVKIGYIRAVQYMYQEEVIGKVINKHQMIIDSISKIIESKNKHKIKSQHEIFHPFRYFAQINPIDFFEFMNEEYNMLDNLYLYNIYGQKMRNSNDALANGIYLIKDLTQKKNYLSIKNYLNQKIRSELEPIFYDLYKDKVAETLLTRIKNQIQDMININRYIDAGGHRPLLDVEDYHQYIDLIINKYKTNVFARHMAPVT